MMIRLTLIFSLLIKALVFCQAQSEFDKLFKSIADESSQHSIVAFGEAVHGTHDFAQVKADCFKYLALNKNFNVFSIEGDYAAASEINDYVHGKEIDVKQSVSQLLRKGSWLYETNVLFDLIEWMRQQNMAGRDLIFSGFDFQGLHASHRALQKFLKENNIEQEFSLVTTELDAYLKNYLIFWNDSIRYQKFDEQLSKLGLLISQSDQFYYPYKTLTQLSKIFFHKKPFEKMNELRDRAMCDNLKYIAEAGNNKVFVWAHNEHLRKDERTRLGYHLKNVFSTSYYAVACEFGSGTFLANPWGEDDKRKIYSIKSPSKKMLASNLKDKFSSPTFIFGDDLSTFGNVYLNAIGFSYSAFNKSLNSRMYNLASAFDGLVFLPEITPLRSIN